MIILQDKKLIETKFINEQEIEDLTIANSEHFFGLLWRWRRNGSKRSRAMTFPIGDQEVKKDVAFKGRDPGEGEEGVQLRLPKEILPILQAMKQEVVKLGKKYPEFAGAKGARWSPTLGSSSTIAATWGRGDRC